MEQIIATFGIDWKVLLVQVLNFGVLWYLLWRFLYQPFLQLIESRRAQIIEGVANAELAGAALRDSQAKKSEILTAAALEAEKLLADARTAAQAREATLMQEAQDRYDQAIREAERKGEEIKRVALAESKEEVARLIVLGVEKTLTQSSSIAA
jgi:F-type H+-transporting ATPase subunit b